MFKLTNHIIKFKVNLVGNLLTTQPPLVLFKFYFSGISKILKYDASIDNSEGELKKNEPQTTLARRRAEKQKLKGNLETKENKK